MDPSPVEPIRHSGFVRSPPRRAFDLFTEHMGSWWPVDEYSRAVSEFHDDGVTVERLEFQPLIEGSVLEHLSDGRILPWARVVVWDPPHGVVLAWRPHSFPEPPTELEVTFVERPRGTLVQVEHRGWELLSEAFRTAMYEVYVRGWDKTFPRYLALADREPG